MLRGALSEQYGWMLNLHWLGNFGLIDEYLEAAGHRDDQKSPLFRPVKNNITGTLLKPLDPQAVYTCIIRKYGKETGINASVKGFCVHSLRSTAATNALEHGADIGKVQEWLVMPMFQRPGYMTEGKAGRRKAQPLE